MTRAQVGKIPFLEDDGYIEGVSAMMTKLRMVRLEPSLWQPRAAGIKGTTDGHRGVGSIGGSLLCGVKGGLDAM